MMKLSDITGHLVTLGLAGVVACSGAKPTPDASALNDQPKAAPQADTKPATPAEQYHAQGQADLDKALEQLRNVSVFFEFDSATLTRDAQDKLTTVGNVLSAHPELRVRIEGNCDERGSGQYNLALGQRRAEAVKKVMTVLGVSDGRIETTSYGEEKPVALGHDEASWAQNRRADIKYWGE